jgi:AcrR family transcriptional regulator
VTKSSNHQSRDADGRDSAVARQRILDAAFDAFMERGYAATSTLEIATRARVSKRELYALVGTKQEILMACIGARAERMQVPATLPVPADRDTLAEVLTAFGTQVLGEITDPSVVAVFRLAIAEAAQAPEVARTLDTIGRDAIRSALRQIMTRARAAGLVDGRPADLAERFGALLWGNVLLGLLLGVADRPSAREMGTRARDATAAFLRLYPAPSDATAPRRS